MPDQPPAHDRRLDQPWWRSAVIYQIYPRSFADANGDGIGDLPGIRSRLGYLADLGVDAVWLSPFYPSPQADAGYDVSDYRDVDPMFGTLDDFAALVRDSHQLGLRVIVDLVPNHTSDRHAWFRSAQTAAPGSPARDRYVFREGRGIDGKLPPNNWVSCFGGSAWTRVADGQWYLHLFAPQQPDLNWGNPEVVAEFEDILRFWLKLGVDGFRVDVAHGLFKDPTLTDLPGGAADLLLTARHAGEHPYWDRDEIHQVYRGWRTVIDEFAGDRMFCAEAWVPNPDRFAAYLRPDELHTGFNFDYLQAPWDAEIHRRVIDRTLRTLGAAGAPATWVLSNHDVTRHRTRLGGAGETPRRARAATLLMLALPGSAYFYQGEELGLPEVLDIPPAQRQDPVYFRTNGENPGRDGCRVPLPWAGTSPPYGFGPAGTPWLSQPDSFAELTAQAQIHDPASTLTFYRTALRLRRRRPDLGDGTLQWIDTPPGLLAFRRGELICAVNFTESALAIDGFADGVELVRSIADPGEPAAGVLPGDTAVWLDVS